MGIIVTTSVLAFASLPITLMLAASCVALSAPAVFAAPQRF